MERFKHVRNNQTLDVGDRILVCPDKETLGNLTEVNGSDIILNKSGIIKSELIMRTTFYHVVTITDGYNIRTYPKVYIRGKFNGGGIKIKDMICMAFSKK